MRRPVLLLTSLLILLACGGPASAPDAGDSAPDAGGAVAAGQDAGAADAGQAVDAGPPPATPRGAVARDLIADGGRLVDVRTAGEFAAGHLPGARNLPLGELPGRLSELEPRAPWIITYCYSGNRSGQASALLTDAGFPHVYDLGAMANW